MLDMSSLLLTYVYIVPFYFICFGQLDLSFGDLDLWCGDFCYKLLLPYMPVNYSIEFIFSGFSDNISSLF